MALPNNVQLKNRCGLDPRQPLLVILPNAKQSCVDHTITDQTSILKFIKGNLDIGVIGNQSFDTSTNSLSNMFDLTIRMDLDFS